MPPSRLIKKIQSASINEVIFRLARKLRLAYDRHIKLHNRTQPHLHDYIRISKHSVLLPTPSSYKEYWQTKNTFYFSEKDKDAIHTFLTKTYPQKVGLLLNKADSICKLEIPFFNKNFIYSSAIDWCKDPLGSKIWPMHHWSKIKVVDTDSGADPKFVWELNRHQYLLYTAMSFGLTRQERYAEFTLQQITDWIKKNPVDHGINWVESLEVGTRLTSWIWVLELLRGSDSLTPKRLSTIFLSMHAHAEHIHRYLSHYISPNTHLTGEALALFLFATVYPEAKRSPQWEREAKKALDTEIVNQVDTDGVHKELSTAYHTYTVDYYFQYLILCKRQNKETDPAVLKRLEMMCEFILFAERPDGSLPLVGDSDGGSALPLDPKQSFSWKDLLCNGALLFNRPDFKFRSPDLCWNSAWLLGKDAQNSLSKILAKEHPAKCKYFKDSNYIVYRSDWTNNADYLFFDAGKMGFLSAGHSHADYLSFELALSGKPFLIDVGTLSYHDKKWRQYCRGTRAHNTITINKQDQARPQGSFSWHNTPKKGRGFLSVCEDYTLIQAEHSSYHGIRHTRSFIVLKNTFLLCFDQILASGLNLYEFNYHFDTDVAAAIKKKSIRAYRENQTNIKMIPLLFQSPKITINKGAQATGKGFYFPTYGEQCQTNTLSISEENTGNFSRGMLFVPDTDSHAEISYNDNNSPGDCCYSLQLNKTRYKIHAHLQAHQITIKQKISIDCDFLIEQHLSRDEATFFAVGVNSFRCEDIQLVKINNKLNSLLVKRQKENVTICYSRDDQLDTRQSCPGITFQIMPVPR